MDPARVLLDPQLSTHVSGCAGSPISLLDERRAFRVGWTVAPGPSEKELKRRKDQLADTPSHHAEGVDDMTSSPGAVLLERDSEERADLDVHLRSWSCHAGAEGRQLLAILDASEPELGLGDLHVPDGLDGDLGLLEHRGEDVDGAVAVDPG